MKFAKLLPDEGWTPLVATPSNPDHPVADASLNAEVADVETWRFPIWEPSRTLRAWGVGGQGRLGAERRGQGSLLSRMAKWVRGNMFVPDARVTWVKPTTKALVRKLKEQPVDLVVTTGPPHSMHLVGLGLKRALGVPWIDPATQTCIADDGCDGDMTDDGYISIGDILIMLGVFGNDCD